MDFFNNAWLSGFTDGCFTITIQKRSETYTQYMIRYILSQKGEKEILIKIGELLGGKISY
jgi:hypothetical protein